MKTKNLLGKVCAFFTVIFSLSVVAQGFSLGDVVDGMKGVADEPGRVVEDIMRIGDETPKEGTFLLLFEDPVGDERASIFDVRIKGQMGDSEKSGAHKIIGLGEVGETMLEIVVKNKKTGQLEVVKEVPFKFGVQEMDYEMNMDFEVKNPVMSYEPGVGEVMQFRDEGVTHREQYKLELDIKRSGSGSMVYIKIKVVESMVMMS